MKTNHFFLLIIGLLFAGSLSAQEAPEQSLSLSWGMGNMQRQDLTFSPMIHRDWSPLNFMLVYKRSKKLEQQFSVKFAQYKDIIGEPFEYTSFYDEGVNSTYPHVFTLLDLDYALGKKIVEKPSWDLTLGARSSNRLLPTNYSFGNFNSLGYYFSFGLDLWLTADLDLDKHHFSVDLSFPVVAWNARCDYLWHTDEYFWENYSHNGFKAFGNYVKGGEFQSANKAQAIDFDINYYYSLSEKWEIGGRYLVSMTSNQEPTSFMQFENVFYLSGKLKF